MRLMLRWVLALVCCVLWVLGNDEESEDRWGLKDKKGHIALYPHKAVYILPFYYSFSTPGAGNLREETKFQFSFKMLMSRDFLSPYGRLYFAYTQTSWFQNYNKMDSRPFRDTDYQPELFYSYEGRIDFLGGAFKDISFGYVHTSNGERELRSRTQNRLLLQAKWEYPIGAKGALGVQAGVWVYVGTNFEGFIHDNRDLAKYRGYNDLKIYYKNDWHLIEAYMRPLLTLEYYPYFELSYTLRIMRNMGIYVQYVNGYGDNMYEYNLKSQRLGIGFSLWNEESR